MGMERPLHTPGYAKTRAAKTVEPMTLIQLYFRMRLDRLDHCAIL
jgi:hypothetical protein